MVNHFGQGESLKASRPRLKLPQSYANFRGGELGAEHLAPICPGVAAFNLDSIPLDVLWKHVVDDVSVLGLASTPESYNNTESSRQPYTSPQLIHAGCLTAVSGKTFESSKLMKYETTFAIVCSIGRSRYRQ